MSQEIESVLRKIKHLLNKTESAGCTAEEAAAAAEKAKALLDEYSLSLNDLPRDAVTSRVVRIEYPIPYSRIPSWYCALAAAIAEAFEVKPLVRRGDDAKLMFIGLPADVESAFHFFVVLSLRFRAQAEIECLKYNGNSRIFIANFIIGAGNAVNARLTQLRANERNENIRAVSIVKKDAIAEFLKGVRLGKPRQMHYTHDDNGMQAGTEYGNKVDLSTNRIQ